MSRFETKFAELAAKKEGAFVPFVTLCDPTFDRSFEIICTLVENGADALELGFPFSDPLLDGPVIQAANNRALNAGHSTEDSFKLLAKVRSTYPKIPISLLLCANLIFAKGLDNFYQRCAEVGVDGLIIPDLPKEEQFELVEALDNTENAPILIQLVAPVSADRIPMILENARGYVYCVSSMGVTGQAAHFHKNVRKYLENVKAVSKIPVMMGFGIRTAEDVAGLKDTIDGCIVGTHFIELMEENNYDLDVAKEYIRTFKRELNA